MIWNLNLKNWWQSLVWIAKNKKKKKKSVSKNINKCIWNYSKLIMYTSSFELVVATMCSLYLSFRLPFEFPLILKL